MLNKSILFVKSSVTLPQGDGVPYQRITTLVRLLKIQKCKLPKFKKTGVTLAGGDGAPYQQIPHWIRLGFCQITTIRQFWHSCKSITSKALGSISSKIYKRDLIHLNMMMFSDVAEYLHLNMM